MKKIFTTVIFYIIAIITLKLFSLINTSWILLLLPFWLVLSVFIIYLIVIYISSLIYVYNQKKEEEEYLTNTETSFHCNKCAKPFDEPIRHFKNETIICKNCNKKTF